MRTSIPNILIATTLWLLPVWADAQPNTPETEDIIRALTLKPSKPHALTRSWADKGISVENGRTKPTETSRIDLEVNFAYDSDRLSTDAQLILNRLGNALNSNKLRDQRFKITGHTDAVGSEPYNLDLSRRRALSVQEYLVRKLSIDGSRLETEGKGYSQLADPTHPTDGVNRRVEVINLGS